ncbi:DNA topoisomerase IB [Methylovorus sp. MP688]|uniref:DNA topoisomerase IB n=1 Tax=Methylovorus sp. (strain MP688) TaxID=887061 RepID=UPI0001EC4450|nr:DNA topoisomerase IB [Methylovorus sp. MP688]ADQ83610.1 DNA topoisomerase [Methylovorus sp. MP688]
MPDTPLDECTVQLNDALGAELHGDMALSAEAARLRYVNDGTPGFARKRMAKGFRYVDRQGRPLHDKTHLARIRALAIPPAWQDVWICPYANGHIQATGIDAKGRKQYRYHKEWRAIRDEAKYAHMLDFALHLPLIREQVDADLARPALCREKVLALVIALLEKTMIRVGNDEYARTNRSFGLTTLRNRHVDVQGGRIAFHFRGKSRVEHAIELQNARLARLVRKMKDLPGQALFQYVDDAGERHAVSSSDVNAYLKSITGRDYTAKDFRTWSGTLHTFQSLTTLDAFENQTQAKKNVVQAITEAARKLGNTPTICRKCYVHPLIIETYMAGKLLEAVEQETTDKDAPWALDAIERHVLHLLQRQIADARKSEAA